jgi:hypothetical protein
MSTKCGSRIATLVAGFDAKLVNPDIALWMPNTTIAGSGNLTFVDSKGRDISHWDLRTNSLAAYPNGGVSEEAWGIRYDQCLGICGPGYELSSWSDFSRRFTAWLLPFLALTAQLPFEARSIWSNIMCLFLAVGSP